MSDSAKLGTGAVIAREGSAIAEVTKISFDRKRDMSDVTDLGSNYFENVIPGRKKLGPIKMQLFLLNDTAQMLLEGDFDAGTKSSYTITLTLNAHNILTFSAYVEEIQDDVAENEPMKKNVTLRPSGSWSWN